MMEAEFDINTIQSVDFGISVGGGYRVVPVDGEVQNALKEMLQTTVQNLLAKEEAWEEYSVSEEYSNNRKLYSPRESELMEEMAKIYKQDGFPDIVQMPNSVQDIRFYFAVFRDADSRKLIAVRRAAQFKGFVKARNKLIRVIDNTLKIIHQDVFKLDFSFDVLICDKNIYIEDVKGLEYLAFLTEAIANSAEGKLQKIQAAIPFLDLRAIVADIGSHPRTARLVVSIKFRANLANFDRSKIEAMANAQGMKLITDSAGNLRPRATDRHALMEILDDRRYVSNLTTTDPEPFRAKSRQRVKPA